MSFEWIMRGAELSLLEAVKLFVGLLPYIFIGALIGEALKFTSWTDIIRKWIGNKKSSAVFIAMAFGIISPLCTFGTVPVVISLYKEKIPLSPLIAFLSASALMNPQLFILLAGGISLDFALASLAIAVTFPVLTGLIMINIPESYVIRKKHSENNVEQPKVKNEWNTKEYIVKIGKQLLFVGKYVFAGAVIGTLIENFIPSHYMLYLFEGNETATIFIAALAGIPLYACGGGAIPVIRLMMAQGMTFGTAIAFMTVGQGTRLSPLMALATIIRPAFLVLYTISLILYTTLFGSMLPL